MMWVVRKAPLSQNSRRIEPQTNVILLGTFLLRGCNAFMPDQNSVYPAQPDNEPDESFGDLLSQYERSHSRATDDGSRQLQGTVVAVTADSVLFDIGYKTEGILPLSVFQSAGETV